MFAIFGYPYGINIQVLPMDKNYKIIPPKLAERLLLWFLRNDLAEEVQGDLEENFYKVAENKSVFRAKVNYWYQVIQYLRPFAIKNYSSKSNYFIMYQHNLKLTYRNFLKYRSSFFINLIGLATGMACAFLIYLWVMDELSMDKFHSKDKQLYQVLLNHEENGILRTGPGTQGILGEALEQEVPEVILAVEDTDSKWFGENFVLSNGEEFIKAAGKFSAADYFRLFSFGFKHGNPEDVLSDKKAIVITESLAQNLFGTTEGIVGKSIEWQLLQFKGQAEITGILKDLPRNSTEQFDFVLPFQIYKEVVGGDMNWGNYNTYTYVELAEGTDINQLNNKLAGFVKEKADWSNVTPFFKKYSENYLYGTYENGVVVGGRITYVKLFAIVAAFVLIIACINFMNLSTARASRRLKEIGIKKTLGAARKSLISQFIGEALLITLMAFIVAFLLVYLLLPQFNELTGKSLTLQMSPHLLFSILGIIFFTGLMAGSYPALYLSGFKPLNILKGKLNTSSFGEFWTRQGLVVFQFVLSIILVVSVLVVYKQIEYVQTTNLGYDRESVIKIPAEGKAVDNIQLFMSELKKVPGVINASATSHSVVQSSGYTTGIKWEGKDPDINIRFEQGRAYYDLIETLSIKLKEGRSFSNEFGDEKSKIIFNEAAIEVMGIEDPIGKIVNMWGDDKEIIGVTENWHFASLHNKVEPMLFHFDTEYLQHILIKIDGENIRQSIKNINSFYKSFNPGYALDYTFLDQNYQEQYVAEERISVLSRFFAGIAIIISCLGLFGLAAFTAERRQKEIGIRKILGAGNLKIISLLSGDFTKMVLVAIFIAIPASYLIAIIWLEKFAYKIELEWWFFAGAGVLALLIAWLTVSIQTVKAANINPVQCLKDE